MNTVIYDLEGRIIGRRSGHAESVRESLKSEKRPYLECGPEVSSQTHYVQDGQIKKKPGRPSELHSWNYRTKSWEMDEAWLMAKAAKLIREKRADLLAASDWTQVPDCPLNDMQVAQWAIYRQQLRDMPETHKRAVDYEQVVWPEPPRI